MPYYTLVRVAGRLEGQPHRSRGSVDIRVRISLLVARGNAEYGLYGAVARVGIVYVITHSNPDKVMFRFADIKIPGLATPETVASEVADGLKTVPGSPGTIRFMGCRAGKTPGTMTAAAAAAKGANVEGSTCLFEETEIGPVSLGGDQITSSSYTSRTAPVS